MPTPLGELSRESFWVAILTAVWPALLTAAREALELNHVEAGLLQYLCDPRQRMGSYPTKVLFEYLARGAMSLHAVHRS